MWISIREGGMTIPDIPRNLTVAQMGPVIAEWGACQCLQQHDRVAGERVASSIIRGGFAITKHAVFADSYSTKSYLMRCPWVQGVAETSLPKRSFY